MSVVTRLADRFASRVPEVDVEGMGSAVSYSGSVAIHVLFVVLMLVGINVHVELPHIEVPIEIVVEAVPKNAAVVQAQNVPTQPLPNPPPPAATDRKDLPASAFDAREIADDEHQRIAAPDRSYFDGKGTAAARTAVQNELPPGPKDPLPRQTVVAPPGEGGKPTAREQPKDKPADEMTAQRKPIQCGANAKLPTPSSPELRRGQIVGLMTKEQADRLIQISQANYDMFINPDYVDNVRAFIQVDGASGGPNVVLVPPGMTVKKGDRVEFVRFHLDPSRPCHYIPPVIARVL